MKVLLITTALQGVTGPSIFASFLYNQKDIDLEVLVENEEKGPRITTFSVTLNWLQKKLSSYSRVALYQKKLQSIIHNYDILLFSSGILAYKIYDTKRIPVIMINDDNYVSSKLNFSKQSIINFIYRNIEKKLVQQNSYIIVNSNYLKEKIVLGYGCNPKNIFVLHKATNIPSELKPLVWNHSSPIKILFVKNDFERGGLFDLLKALGKLKKHIFTLSIVGCNPKLEKQLPTNVKSNVYGYLSHSQVLKLMNTQNVFCVPSHREALGVANMEAMAKGIPVVTTDVGGIPEVITDKEGWIAKPKNPESLAIQLEKCITQHELREQKLVLAREKVKQFSTENMIISLNEILQEIQLDYNNKHSQA